MYILLIVVCYSWKSAQVMTVHDIRNADVPDETVNEEDCGGIANSEIEIRNELSQLQGVSEKIFEGKLHQKIAYKQYICLKCTYSENYSNKLDVYNHIRNDHYGLKYKCTKCNIYVSEAQLKNHLEDIHQLYIPDANEDATLHNGIESYFEISFAYAYREFYKKLPNKRYTCLKCLRRKSQQFHEKEQVVLHIKSKHEMRYSCVKCPGRYLRSRLFLREHLIKDHLINISKFEPDFVIHDDECDEETIGVQQEPQSELDKLSTFNYKGMYYKDNSNKYFCVKCCKNQRIKYTYCRKVEMLSHIQYFHLGIRFICKKCMNVYEGRSSIMKHLKQAHGIQDMSTRESEVIIKRLTDTEIIEFENIEYSKIIKSEIPDKVKKKILADQRIVNKKNITEKRTLTHKRIAKKRNRTLKRILTHKRITKKRIITHKRIAKRRILTHKRIAKKRILTHKKINKDHYICLQCKYSDNPDDSEKFDCLKSLNKHKIKYHKTNECEKKESSKIIKSELPKKADKVINRILTYKKIAKDHYICLQCKYSDNSDDSEKFDCLKSLNKHKRKYHKSNEFGKKVSSKIINSELPKKAEKVKRRILTHKRVAKDHYICLQCKYSDNSDDSEKFDSLKTLNKHKRKYHKSIGSKSEKKYMRVGCNQYICLDCKDSEKYRSLWSVNNHRRRYHTMEYYTQDNNCFAMEESNTSYNETMMIVIDKEEPQIQYEHVAASVSSAQNNLSSCVNTVKSSLHTNQEELTSALQWKSGTNRSQGNIKKNLENYQDSVKQIKLENDCIIHTDNGNYEITMMPMDATLQHETTVMSPDSLLKQEPTFLQNCYDETTMMAPETMFATDGLIKNETSIQNFYDETTMMAPETMMLADAHIKHEINTIFSSK